MKIKAHVLTILLFLVILFLIYLVTHFPAQLFYILVLIAVAFLFAGAYRAVYHFFELLLDKRDNNNKGEG